MKHFSLVFAGIIAAAGFSACNDGTNVTNATSTSQADVGTATAVGTSTTNYTSTNAVPNSKLPINPQDSAFVMKAAMGGIMEVEGGNAAQQNAQNARVKAYGAMMVKDHSSSNQELMRLASSRGMNVPATLPPDMKSHVDAMRNMKGVSFDNHYMQMMVADHQRTIAEFEKQANGGTDRELKAFAAKTLPALKMHHDSAVAINNGIKQ